MLKFLLVCGVVVAAAIGGAAWVNTQRPESPAPAGSTAQGQRAPKYIASVTPEAVPEGTVYHVRPTRAGRLAVGDALDVAFEQAVALGLPRRESLRHQFMCHPLSVIARAKFNWDVESWRPEVGQIRTMLAGCDPQ